MAWKYGLVKYRAGSNRIFELTVGIEISNGRPYERIRPSKISKVRYSSFLSLDTILRQFRPPHMLADYFLKIHLTVILHCHFESFKWRFTRGFSAELCMFSQSFLS
jgi:hypothetical protein